MLENFIVSDCPKHDPVTEYSFILTMVSHLKTILPSIRRVHVSLMGQLVCTKISRPLLTYVTTKMTTDLKQNGITWQQAMARAPVMVLSVQRST